MSPLGFGSFIDYGVRTADHQPIFAWLSGNPDSEIANEMHNCSSSKGLKLTTNLVSMWLIGNLVKRL